MVRERSRSKKTVFVCQQCGKESLKWLGRCPNCQQWNTLVETVVSETARIESVPGENRLRELSRVTVEVKDRFPIQPAEFNRVLGGGMVSGALMLISGDPGIGKSTLLLQVAALVAQDRGEVVYVSGEETLSQIKIRAQRLGISGEKLYLLAENNMDAIFDQLEQMEPKLIILDSIQTMYLPDLETTAGSVGQVRECTLRMMGWAKPRGIPVFLTGHVTKEGAIAGPKVLEHIVDVVLYLEGEAFSAYRLLRCIKNRFGSTNEVGVFEMKEGGMTEVDNPSRAFLSQRGEQAIGSAVVSTIEGSRPLLVEIQALTNPTSFGLPRRTANGIDFGRLHLITAVLSKRVGLKLWNQDVIANATGGIRISEPAADLGIALAIASSYHDSPVDPELVVAGEIGLSGELRAVPQMERRAVEAGRLGFKRCLVPRSGARIAAKNIEVIRVSSLQEAVRAGLGK